MELFSVVSVVLGSCHCYRVLAGCKRVEFVNSSYVDDIHVFSVYVSKLLYVVFSAVGRLFRSKRKGRRVNYGVYAGIPLSLVAFIFMWWGALFTRNEIVVENVTVVSGDFHKSSTATG